MKRDIRRWCKECPDCQASKVHRHTRSPLVERQFPSDRFRSLHGNLVGPLPESHGMTYLFTIIDHYTRWPEAIPLPDTHASTCVSALLHHWVARFGVPEDIVSDRGRQLTSNLWSGLNKLLGKDTNTTTAYHPQANGMVERLHRQLKAALKARTTGPDWFDELPIVLLGIRSSWRVDPDCSPAELIYGTTLRIPDEFLQPCDTSTNTPDIIFEKSSTKHALHSTTCPTNPRKSNLLCALYFSYGKIRLFKERLAQRHYDGPFCVVSKSDKYFTLEIKGRPETVSIDRLKTAYVTPLTTEENKEVPISPKSILTDNPEPNALHQLQFPHLKMDS
ncbi:Gag pol polyprotein [Elysia marginata]|uniref:Gag pol polyprotein n=1 Tax=Elysia marginata TaxID=1093978 RepID=A0AAV4FDA4_9GAST|nr:Gag pol polyprotein [Elysia marginata]